MKKTPINFDWQFIEEQNEKFIHHQLEGQHIEIPHTIKLVYENYFDELVTQKKVTYQKDFFYELKVDKRLFILFEGVMARCEVYLNGHLIGTHIGGYTAFKYEITDQIKKENRLTIFVDSHETGDHPPFGGVIDYLTYGGIYREVTLIETSKTAVDYVLVDADGTGLNATIKLDRQNDKDENITLKVRDLDKVIFEKTIHIKEDVIKFRERLILERWSISNPKLYEIDIEIDQVHAYTDSFGARFIHVNEEGFFLNGEKVFLRGLNRHQSYPFVGYAMPKSAQYQDADILKFDLAVNIVRSSHYPPSKNFLRRCDEIGLLVFTELPGWQHLGDEMWKAHALEDLKSLLITDYNHPSIVIIGTRINESIDDDDFYTKTRNLAKSIDITRPTGGVRFLAKSKLLEDIYTLNDFTHNGQNQGLSKKSKMTNKSNPYLITEFNGHMFPTKSFDNEERRLEHAFRHYKVLDDAYGIEGVMGAIGWCMNDYHTHKDFGSNDHICHHGVMDINRNPKYAHAVYASQGEKPFLEVLSMMHIGDRQGGQLKEVVVATNLDYVKLYKNDQYIGTYQKDNVRYSNIKQPPIIIKDFIGNQIEKNELFSIKDAKIIKGVLLKTLENDLKMSLWTKIQMAYILIKYKLKYEDAVRLYTTYIGGWGDRTKTYKFEGYLNDQVVKTIYRGNDDHYKIELSKDRDFMSIENTYDVMRLTVKLKNNLDMLAYYSNAVVKIHVEGNLNLIGPHLRSIQGGILSFWVKASQKGLGKIQVKSDYFGIEEMTIETK
jgi:beta-galactosidase